MPVSSVAGQAAGFRTLRESSPGLRLLRAELMPVLVAILGAHLTGTSRTLPAIEFIERVEADLAELRDGGFDLPRLAGEYVASWVADGILVRRVMPNREETVELAESALTAVRFLQGLHRPRSAVTSSRLSNVSDLLARLARDTDPEAASRLEALEAERAALDDEIERVRAGRFEPLGAQAATERLQEIMRLASEIPGDFAKVSADLESVNHDLREQIIHQGGSRGDVLEEVFAGVDLIEQSEPGRTFSAFYSLVLDPERSGDFDAAVDGLLSRQFMAGLPGEQRAFLRGLLTTLQDESTQARRQMTGFSRSLRRFVESRAYQEHRRLAEALGTAQSACLEAFGTGRLLDAVDYELELTSFPLATIGSWLLHNPADTRTASPVHAQANAPLDLAALRAQVRTSEIDFGELRSSVAEALTRRPVASVGDVLAGKPATQGLASIVGLLVLADRYGAPAAGEEMVSWQAEGGSERSASVGRRVFTQVPDSWRQG